MEGPWCWNKEVKQRVQEKKEAHIAFINSGMDEKKEVSRDRYKSAKREAKKVVAIAKSMAYDRSYQNWRLR